MSSKAGEREGNVQNIVGEWYGVSGVVEFFGAVREVVVSIGDIARMQAVNREYWLVRSRIERVVRLVVICV